MPAFGGVLCRSRLADAALESRKVCANRFSTDLQIKGAENGEAESEFAGRMHTMGLVNFTSISSDTL